MLVNEESPIYLICCLCDPVVITVVFSSIQPLFACPIPFVSRFTLVKFI